MRTVLFTLLVVALSACTTVQQTTRVPTKLVAREFNSIASQYLERPTFVSVERMSDGATVLRVSMTMYGSDTSTLPMLRGKSTEYSALIDKFLEWEVLARSRGDAITKEIGRAPAWGNAVAGDLKFTFHSGNSATHYLAVAYCNAGTCSEKTAQYYSPPAAVELRTLVQALDAGKIGANSEGIYK